MSEQSSEAARQKTWVRRLGALVRWLHTYVSMLGFLVLLFFGVTGFTLNHPDWFYAGSEDVRETQGSMDPALLNLKAEDDPPPGDAADAAAGEEGFLGPAMVVDCTQEIDKLAVVETLRGRHALAGAVSELSADEFQCIVMFKGPGYSADVFIDRATGEYSLTETRQGIVAVLNDLHTGRAAGPAWSWVIDVSALVMATASVTGLALLVFYKRRRLSGLLAAAIGSVAVILIYLLYVP